MVVDRLEKQIKKNVIVKPILLDIECDHVKYNPLCEKCNKGSGRARAHYRKVGTVAILDKDRPILHLDLAEYKGHDDEGIKVPNIRVLVGAHESGITVCAPIKSKTTADLLLAVQELLLAVQELLVVNS